MSNSNDDESQGSGSKPAAGGTIRASGATIGSGIGGSGGGTVRSAGGSDVASGIGGATGTVRARVQDVASGFGPAAGLAASGLNQGDRITLNGQDYTYDGVISKSSGEAEIFLLRRQGTPLIFKLYNPNVKPKVEILAALKSLSHKDIVNVVDYGYFHDRFFEIMEYAEGGTLEQYVPIKDLARLRAIIAETLNAFEFCHPRGIIHRDIKPSNIYCRNTDGSDIVIGDFGISSSLDEGVSRRLTSQNLTEGYAAPELYGIDGKVIVGREVDYYALGITLIHLWEGGSPFLGLTRWAISNLTISGTIPVPSDLPKEWQSLIRGLITIDHTKRWGLDEVRRWLNGEDVPVHLHVKQVSYPPFQYDLQRQADSPVVLARLLKQYQERGRKQLYSGKVSAWVNVFDHKLATELDAIVETQYPKDQDAGLYKAIYLLDPDEPLDLGRECRTSAELAAALDEGFSVYQDLLAKPTHPFYLYLEAHEAQKEADAFRALFRTFSGKKALNTVILELAGRQSVTILGRTFTSPEAVLQARDQLDIVKMLKDPESRLSLWMEGAASQAVKQQLAAWRGLKISDATTLAYVAEQGGGVPEIELSPNSISLTDLKTRTTVNGGFEIRNTGQGSLTGTITANKPWLRLGQSKIDPGRKSQTIDFTVDTAGMPYDATDTATIEVRSNVGTEVVSVSIAIEQGAQAVARFRTLLTLGAGAIGAVLGLAIAAVSARTGSDLSALARVLATVGVALSGFSIARKKGSNPLLVSFGSGAGTFAVLHFITPAAVQAALTWSLLLAVTGRAVAPFVMMQTLRATNKKIVPVSAAVLTSLAIAGVLFASPLIGDINRYKPSLLDKSGRSASPEHRSTTSSDNRKDAPQVVSNSKVAKANDVDTGNARPNQVGIKAPLGPPSTSNRSEFQFANWQVGSELKMSASSSMKFCTRACPKHSSGVFLMPKALRKISNDRIELHFEAVAGSGPNKTASPAGQDIESEYILFIDPDSPFRKIVNSYYRHAIHLVDEKGTKYETLKGIEGLELKKWDDATFAALLPLNSVSYFYVTFPIPAGEPKSLTFVSPALGHQQRDWKLRVFN